MNEIGIMLYGYDEVSAKKIRSALGELTERDVILVCGCGREKDLVGDILEDETYDDWEAVEDPKIVMFLGFDGPMIHASIDGFPAMEGQTRPIFCTPTEENIGWTLEDLISDLKEEREFFRKRDEEAERAAGDEKSI
ncbi:MAG: DUF3783 domain-containing protein [Thermoplasmatota archaeon]